MKRFPIRMLSVMLFAIMAVTFMAAAHTDAYTVTQQWARISATAGETLTTGQLVMIADADGYAYKADANDAALRPAVGIVGKGATSGYKVEIIVQGILSGWTSLTEGAPAYLSETAGAVTQSAPAYSQQVGIAISTTAYYFNCQNYFDSSALTVLGTLDGATPLVLEGATANEFEISIAVTDPTADRTVTLSDASGTAMLSTLSTNAPDVANSIWGISNGLAMGGATGADGFELQLKPMGDPAADKYILFPVLNNAASMISTLTTNDVDVANSIWGVSNGLAFGGATGANGFETTLTASDVTADKTITLPNATGTVALRTGEVTASTDVLTAAECGKMIFLAHATEYSTTLPALSTVPAGCQFEFIIQLAASGANYTVLTGNSLENKIYGSMEVNGAVVACADEDTITLVDGNAVGDWVKVRSDGTNWYITGSTVTAAKATCTQAD